MAELTFQVTDMDTAVNLRSGDLPVLGTPRLINWLEACTITDARADITPGDTTVGCRVNIAHLRPSGIGEMITVRSQRQRVEGNRFLFRVTATNRAGALVAEGEIERVRVDSEAFLQRLAETNAQ